MYSSLKNLFEKRLAVGTEKVSEQEQLALATCILLLEAAHADDEFTEVERRTVGELLGNRFGLAIDETAELMALAEQEREKSPDLYQFAQLINDNYPQGRKLAIVELLWQVVFSDGVLAAHEDALMHKLGKLLGVRHGELMALKLRAKRTLANGSDPS